MGKWIRELVQALERGQQFVTHGVWVIGLPGEEMPSGFIIKNLRVAILLFTSLWEGTLLLRASALAFATVLSIVPFLAIMFYVITVLHLDEGIYQVFEERLEGTLSRVGEFFDTSSKDEEADASESPEELVDEPPDGTVPDTSPVVEEAGALREEAMTTADARGPPEEGESDGAEPEDEVDAETQAAVDGKGVTLRRQLVKTISRGVGLQSEEHVDPIQWLVDLASEAGSSRGGLSVAGLLLLLTTVFGLLRNIESSFNQIWGLHTTRSWYRMISDYVMITLLLPVVAAALLGVTAALQSEEISGQLGLLAFVVQGAQHLLVGLVFAALYYVVPNTQVRKRYALLGGIIAGALWILLSWAYVEFQIGLANYNIVFSTFAQFPMLLMWVYLSWVILLMGAELTFAYQYEKTFAMERHSAQASFAYREALALRAAMEAGRRFAGGLEGLNAEAAAKDWNVPSMLLKDILDDLHEADLLRPVATDPITYLPSRPLDRIRVGDVVEALREVGREPSLLREDETFRPLFRQLEPRDGPFNMATIENLLERMEGGESHTPSSDQRAVHDPLPPL